MNQFHTTIAVSIMGMAAIFAVVFFAIPSFNTTGLSFGGNPTLGECTSGIPCKNTDAFCTVDLNEEFHDRHVQGVQRGDCIQKYVCGLCVHNFQCKSSYCVGAEDYPNLQKSVYNRANRIGVCALPEGYNDCNRKA